MNGFKFDFSKIFWGGAHRAPSPDPSPRFFLGLRPRFGLRPQFSGASRPRLGLRSRPQEGGGIVQAWTTWPEVASAPNGTVMYRGHGVPKISNSSFVRLKKQICQVKFCHDKRLSK